MEKWISGSCGVVVASHPVSVASGASRQRDARAGYLSAAPPPPGEAWGTLPETETGFDTVDPSSVVELAVSMEAKAAPGRLFTRVLVDGDPVQSSDVTMVQNVDAWGAYQFTFQLKNVPAGKHSAAVQTMTDPCVARLA